MMNLEFEYELLIAIPYISSNRLYHECYMRFDMLSTVKYCSYFFAKKYYIKKNFN